MPGFAVGITRAKRAVQKILLDGLPPMLAALDAAEGDGIRTPPPFETHLSNREALGGYPAIEFHGASTALDVTTTAEVAQHRIVCTVSVAGDDEIVLTAQVERYVTAIRKLLRDYVGTPPGVNVTLWKPIETAGEEYTPVIRPSGVEQPFVKGGFIEVRVTTVE